MQTCIVKFYDGTLVTYTTPNNFTVSTNATWIAIVSKSKKFFGGYDAQFWHRHETVESVSITEGAYR